MWLNLLVTVRSLPLNDHAQPVVISQPQNYTMRVCNDVSSNSSHVQILCILYYTVNVVALQADSSCFNQCLACGILNYITPFAASR